MAATDSYGRPPLPVVVVSEEEFLARTAAPITPTSLCDECHGPAGVHRSHCSKWVRCGTCGALLHIGDHYNGCSG